MRPRTDAPHRARFGLVGLALAAGAPAGLLALRLAVGDARLSALALEWQRDALTYTYVALSTAVVFTAFGAALGAAADRLADLATRDALTGLLNRAGMKERLAVEVQRQHRHPSPLSLLVLDVDRMKAINDRYGHAAGDAALRHVAAAIRRTARATDVGGRWGGDEFLVLLPATALADAAALAGRIRSAVAAPTEDGRAVSVSIGVAAGAAVGATASVGELLQAADDALYEAKRAGGDRAAAHPALA